MCTDRDTATDPDTTTFFLDHVVIYAILCVLMDGHVSHLHHFFSSCGFSSFLPFFLVDGNACVVQPALDQQNYEGWNRAAQSTGRRKRSLWPKFWWLQHFLFPQSDIQQWFWLNWCDDWCRKKVRKMQSSVYINTTKMYAIPCAVTCNYVCTQSFCWKP